MNKNFFWITIVLAGVLAVYGFSESRLKDSSDRSSVIKIGVVGPMTGGAAVYGQGLVKGIELARKDLESGVGSDGKKLKHTYEVIVEDDGTNPATAASAAQKLVNVDKVQALITVSGGTGNAVKPIATAAKVPHICVCSDPTVADAFGYNLTNVVLPDDEARVWLAEAQAQGVKKVAILGQIQPGFNLLIENLKKEAPAYGIAVVSEERFDGKTNDFKTIIAKSRSAKPDTYLAGAFPPSLDILVTELKNVGIQSIAGMGTFSISPNLSLYDGLWFTDAALADTAFKTRFETAYPEARFNVRTAPYGYDTFNILVQAFESDGRVNESLLGMTRYEGKVGMLSKKAGSGNFQSPVGIWKMLNGEAVQVK